ncbi:ATP-binding protein [Fusibacter paucivorans]|uniref:ATP-binding protein n=1 Tax=Fusibacter paucivorans TaxID=76009 RepID=A0ABS5PNN0_9FIRM|nr:ATP-binding protein [Fusibacter paucivorans]MBS7526784.1 ATP-binding protein [Fusibacter paucivorans]
MKQMLILSGKGGTGKTTVASAFIKLSRARFFADCDVDAPNLHLLMMRDRTPTQSDYSGMPKAVINQELCISCGLCYEHCRFDAIAVDPNYHVNAFACEGCGVCEYQCPVNAVQMTAMVDGTLKLYQDEAKAFSTAKLSVGSGTSGKLVTAVKTQLKDSIKNGTTANYSDQKGEEIVIIDGSPGIGCPVIASISGVDMVLVVAEPTLSGMSDMLRILETSKKMGTRAAVCINKYDVNEKIGAEIERYCETNAIPYFGAIPFDEQVPHLINEGFSIIDSANNAGNAVKQIYLKAVKALNEQPTSDTGIVKSITALQ